MSEEVSISDAYQAVRNNQADWLCIQQGNSVINLDSVTQTGKGYENLLSKLPEDNIAFLYTRIEINGNAKFVFIIWVGEAASPLNKGKVSVNKPMLKGILKDFALELGASDIADLQYEIVCKKLA
jgi:hypothetical protein